MVYTGNYIADFDIWKNKLSRKEKEDLIKELNGDWSAIYKAWHYRFKQEVWFPYKLSLGNETKHSRAQLSLIPFLIKTENRAEYRSNETKHSRAQPNLMTTDNVVPATEAVQDVMTTDNVVPVTEAVQDGDFYPCTRVQERNR